MMTSSTGEMTNGDEWILHPDQRLIDDALDEAIAQEEYNEWHIFEQRNLPEGSSLVAYDEAIRAARFLHVDTTILQRHSSVPF